MAKKLSRRDFLKLGGVAVGGVALGGLAACRPGPAATPIPTPTPGSVGETITPEPAATPTPTLSVADRIKGETITIFVYGGVAETAVRSYFVDRFEADTGVKVILDPGWWDSIPKLKASPPGDPAFDLILTDPTQGWPAINEGLIEKLNFNNIPNVNNLAPQVTDNWVVNDGWGVTWPAKAHVMAWNKNLIQFEPKNWGDLLRPELDGQLSFYSAYYMSLYTFACMKVAQEGKPGTAREEMATNLDAVLDFAKSQRDRVKYWWPTSMDGIFNLLQENVSIGNMHGPDIYQQLVEKKPLGIFVPDEDRAVNGWIWIVPKGTKHKEAAEAAINALCGNVFQWDLATKTGLATGNFDIASQVGPKDSIWASMNPWKKEHFDNLGFYPYEAYDQNFDKISSVWDKEILRKG